jgi:hypothetical protein
LKSHFAGKSIRFEVGKGEGYLGLYGSPEPSFFYIGFEVHRADTPKMSLYIQTSLKGKRSNAIIPKELKKNYRERDFARGRTWFVFTKAVDKALNGGNEALVS